MTFRLRLYLCDSKGQIKSIWKQLKPIANSMKMLVRLMFGVSRNKCSNSFCKKLFKSLSIGCMVMLKSVFNLFRSKKKQNCWDVKASSAWLHTSTLPCSQRVCRRSWSNVWREQNGGSQTQLSPGMF